MKFYGLRLKKTRELMGFSACSNDNGEECVDVRYSLKRIFDKNEEIPWLVSDKEIAEKAAINNTEWFAAEYKTPENDFIGKLEVVEFSLDETRLSD